MLEQKTALKERLASYLKYLEADATNVRLIVDSANIYLELGEFSSARQLLKEKTAVIGVKDEFVYLSATIDIATGEFAEAKEKLETLLLSGADNLGVRHNLAYVMGLLGDFNEALAIIAPAGDKPVALDFPSLLLSARLLHHKGEMLSALNVLDDAISLSPEHAEAHGLKSLLCFDLGDLQGARESADRSALLDGAIPETNITLGFLALDTFDRNIAETYFENTLKALPSCGRAWMGKALASMMGKDPMSAEQHFEKALAEMPDNIASWNAMAWCQLSQEKLDAAEKSWMRCLEIDRNFAEIHGGLAVLNFIKGNDEEAKELIKKSLGLNPSSFSGLFARAILAEKGGRSKRSAQILEGILTSPIDGDAGENLAQVLTRFAAKEKSNGKDLFR